MSVETTKAVEIVKTGIKNVEGLVKKAWSIMDAASEKQAPSKYLSSHAISAMQGKISGQ